MNELAKGKQAADELGLALDEETLEFDDILEALADSVGDDPYVHDLLNQLAEQHGAVARTANNLLGNVQQLIEQVKTLVQATFEERDKAIREAAVLRGMVEYFQSEDFDAEHFAAVSDYNRSATAEYLVEVLGWDWNDARSAAALLDDIAVIDDEADHYLPLLTRLTEDLQSKRLTEI